MHSCECVRQEWITEEQDISHLGFLTLTSSFLQNLSILSLVFYHHLLSTLFSTSLREPQANARSLLLHQQYHAPLLTGTMLCTFCISLPWLLSLYPQLPVEFLRLAEGQRGKQSGEGGSSCPSPELTLLLNMLLPAMNLFQFPGMNADIRGVWNKNLVSLFGIQNKLKMKYKNQLKYSFQIWYFLEGCFSNTRSSFSLQSKTAYQKEWALGSD